MAGVIEIAAMCFLAGSPPAGTSAPSRWVTAGVGGEANRQDISKSDRELLISLTERVKVVQRDVAVVQRDVAEVKNSLPTRYVTAAEFGPVRTVVYGAVGVGLLAIAGALVSLVVRKHPAKQV